MLRTIKRPTRVYPLCVRSLNGHRRWLTTQWPERPEKQGKAPKQSAPRNERPGESRSEEPQITSISTTIPLDIEQIRERLRTWSVRKASALRVRMDEFSATAQAAFQRLGGRVNEVTGYSEIENMKKRVTENERRMNEIREEAKAAKQAYEEAVARRSNSQRETNELLQRKSSWNDADVLRFTQLVRADHSHEQEEARAQARVEEVDAIVERHFSELMRSILSRYHEEQVWSDKIRSASTYGSLAALGLNLVVFILAIVLVEPWKRKRLVQSFERRVIELNEANQGVIEVGLKELKEAQEEQEKVLAEIRAAQATLKEETVFVGALDGEGEGEGQEVVATEEFERNAKAARDRQIMIVSAASAVGAGIVGYVLGSYFN